MQVLFVSASLIFFVTSLFCTQCIQINHNHNHKNNNSAVLSLRSSLETSPKIHYYVYCKEVPPDESQQRRNVHPFLPIREGGRIIGGHVADIRKHKFVASLILKTQLGIGFNGGAAIISKYWAITAAHCMTLFEPGDIPHKRAYIHSNSTFWSKRYIEHLIVKAYSHKKYNPDLSDYDIAVVKVKQPFNGKNEKPIPLAKYNYKYQSNVLATVFGWGTTKRNTTPFVVETLRYVTIKITDSQTCRSRYWRDDKFVTFRMVCGGARGKDSCVYDSGGPLIQGNTLIGLVSWGHIGCADQILPGVYTKISVFYPWIMRRIRRKRGAELTDITSIEMTTDGTTLPTKNVTSFSATSDNATNRPPA